MNTNTTIERIESVNTVPSTDALPTGMWSADELLTSIDERSHPMTDLKHAPTREPNPASANRWRGPAIAVGIAAVVLLVAGVLGVLAARSDDGAAAAAPATSESAPDVPVDPLEIVREMDRRFDASDPTFIGFYDEEAIGAGVIGVLMLDSRYWSATGMTATREYSVDGAVVTVDTVATSGLDSSRTYEYTVRYRIEDGRIVDAPDVGIDARTADRSALAAYTAWVQANHPEKYEDLVIFGTTLATQTDELVRLQRQMIAQYHEATGTG